MKGPRRAWSVVAMAVLLALLPGCLSKFVGQRVRKDDSLVVLYLDLSRSPSYWRKVSLLCEDRRGGRPWWHMHTDGKGLYYREGAPVGRCWIVSGFQDGIVTRIYKLPEAAERNPTTTSIPAPGIHYMGSYKFEPQGGDDFRLAPTKAVSEREALKRLLPWTQGTAWEGMVRKRL